MKQLPKGIDSSLVQTINETVLSEMFLLTPVLNGYEKWIHSLSQSEIGNVIERIHNSYASVIALVHQIGHNPMVAEVIEKLNEPLEKISDWIDIMHQSNALEKLMEPLENPDTTAAFVVGLVLFAFYIVKSIHGGGDNA